MKEITPITIKTEGNQAPWEKEYEAIKLQATRNCLYATSQQITNQAWWEKLACSDKGTSVLTC